MNVPVWIVALVILWVTPLANASNDMRSNHIALVKQTSPFNCGLAALAMLLSAGAPKPVTLTSLSGLAITLIAPASQEYRDRGFSVSELQRLAAAYGCISALEVFKEPRPFTADFINKNPKVSDISNYEITNIIKENITLDKIQPLFKEFVNRYSEEQKKFYELKSKHHNCYSEQDLLMAMQFAVNDITGRKLRTTVLETMVEDFLKEKEK